MQPSILLFTGELTGRRFTQRALLLFQNNSREYVEKYVITCTESLRTQLEVTYPGMFKKGSLMRVDYDKNNKLKSATLAFSNNACSEFYTSVYDYYNTMCGTVTAVDPTLGSWGYMNVNAVGTDYIIQPRGSILIIDTAKDKHYVGSVADVRAGDRIFVHYVAAQGRMNVIFR